jgi:hypothetical protein
MQIQPECRRVKLAGRTLTLYRALSGRWVADNEDDNEVFTHFYYEDKRPSTRYIRGRLSKYLR